MRFFLAMKCLIVVTALLLFAVPAEARGGRGGGGGGRGRVSSGGGHGSGGPKWSNQQSHNGGGEPKVTEHGQKPAQGGKQQAADERTQPGKDKQPAKTARSTPTNAGDTSDAYNKKQKQLEIEQRNRDKRIAQAQHLREIGERNGNQNLLDNADRMEAFAHDHYARRVSHLEKFGVTDPTLDPGGGLTDPLGELGALLP
jgi:hypothetical protein